MGDGQTVNGQAIAIVTVSVILSVLAILSVMLRFFARRYKGAKYFLDDWLIVFALLLTLGVTINNIVGVAIGGIGENEYYRIDLPYPFPYPRELLPQGKVMFVLQILHTCAMPVIKASVLAFYLRLFPTPKFRIAVWVVAAYVFCWWISIFMSTLLQCKPITSNWGTEPTQIGDCFANIFIMYEVAALTNLFSDVAILVLPFPVILGLHMPRKHKIAVLGVFLTGSLVVVAGIGRTVAYFRLKYNADTNFSYWYYPLVIWTSVEPCLGIISACLPTLRPLFSGLSPESILGSIKSTLSLRSFGRRSPTGTLNNSKDNNSSPNPNLLKDTDGFEHLNGEGAAGTVGTTASGTAFGLMPDPNGSSQENQLVALELMERKERKRGLPNEGIVVQEDIDMRVQKAEDKV